MPATPAQVPVSLPRVVLKNQRLSLDVLSYIPLAMVEKYQVAAYEEEGPVLKIAIVYPEQLKQGFYVALKDIGAKVGKKIELFQTDAVSMQYLVKQYRTLENQPKAVFHPRYSSDPKPPLFELGKTVAYNYLKRLPLAYAQTYRLMSVDFLAPNTYWFVTDGSREEELKILLPYIENENNVKIYTLLIAPKEFEDLKEYYIQLSEREDKAETERLAQEQQEKRKKADSSGGASNTSLEIKEQKVAKGVIVPEVQAQIITTEEEKGGLAGLLQKVTQSFTSNSDGKKDEGKVLTEQAALAPSPAGTSGTGTVSTEGKAISPTSQPPAPASSVAVSSSAPTPVAAAGGSDSKKETKPSATSEDEGEIGKLLSKSVESLEELKEHIKKGFIPRIVAAVVSFAIHEKASDIHIEAFEDEVRIRYRVDGQLLDIVKLPPDVHAAMVSRIKILSRLRLDETRVPQDGRFDVNFENAQIDLRVSVMPTVHGEKVVMRILDKSKGVVSLDDLGIAGLAYKHLTQAIQRPFGICLATGPTGSGKSTSLYAILNRIATPNVNVITLEDPVEYEMKGINQSQVRPKIGFTFAEGLRSVLRQDPNIIMVGEIRDGETANMATQAALTGHLVLSTLHTNDAAGAIPRLSNMGIEPFLITSSLNVAVGQRLVRRICQHCKSEITLPAGIQAQISKDLETIAQMNPDDAKRVTKPFKFYQGMGCAVCGGKGYQGRIGIYEVLVMSEKIEELTLARSSGMQIQEVAQKEGMLTMYQDGLLKVIAGVTTLDEVLRETANK